MSKKQDAFYFNNLIDCATYSSNAAKLLKEIMSDFNLSELESYMTKMHEIEHTADLKKHEMTEALIKAFITPVDREDLFQLSRDLDELTDKVEDVLVRIYMNHIDSINPHALQMVDVVDKCCDEVLALMHDFTDFKRSKKLKEHIITVNGLEEQSDRLYMTSMRNLREESSDALYVMAWSDVYTYLEKCADAAEHIAGSIEAVVMKNS